MSQTTLLPTYRTIRDDDDDDGTSDRPDDDGQIFTAMGLSNRLATLPEGRFTSESKLVVTKLDRTNTPPQRPCSGVKVGSTPTFSREMQE